jgi:hypothetical protein
LSVRDDTDPSVSPAPAASAAPTPR